MCLKIRNLNCTVKFVLKPLRPRKFHGFLSKKTQQNPKIRQNVSFSTFCPISAIWWSKTFNRCSVSSRVRPPHPLLLPSEHQQKTPGN